MPETPLFYRDFLREEIAKRKAKNSQYSVRAFAQSLKISPGALSQILNGKRMISRRVSERILARLEISTADRQQFIRSVVVEKQESGIRKIDRHLIGSAKAGAASSQVGIDYEIESAKFAVIADWFHYAILEMTYKKNFTLEPRWIASRLGISQREARSAIRNLLLAGLLEKRGKHWIKSQATIDTKDQSKTTLFHRKRITQVLAKAAESLQADPIDVRNHTALTICIDPRKIPKAKAQIRKFLWELGRELQEGTPSRVYEFSMNLFPLENAEND